MSDETMEAEDVQTSSTELVHVAPAARTVDLRERATDSWTDVLSDVVMLSRGVASTEFVPRGIRCTCGKPNDCSCGGVARTSAAILAGRELGLPPMTGLSATHVIEGSVGISAEMMRSLILQAGHEVEVLEFSRTACRIRGRRAGSEVWTEASFTIQEAAQTIVFISKAKGWGPLSEKPQYQSWPAEMLLARATTRLARMVFPDVIHGMRSNEELQDMTEGEEAPPQVEAPSAPMSRKQTPAARRQVKKPSPSSGEGMKRRQVAPPPPRKQGEAVPVDDPKKDKDEDEDESQTSEPSDDEPDTAEVVEVEVIEEPSDQKRDDTETTQKPPTTGLQGAITAGLMHFKRLGIESREERLWYTSEIVGSKLASAKDMTLEQARGVVHVLEQCRDLKALDAVLDKKRASQS